MICRCTDHGLCLNNLISLIRFFLHVLAIGEETNPWSEIWIMVRKYDDEIGLRNIVSWMQWEEKISAISICCETNSFLIANNFFNVEFFNSWVYGIQSFLPLRNTTKFFVCQLFKPSPEITNPCINSSNCWTQTKSQKYILQSLFNYRKLTEEIFLYVMQVNCFLSIKYLLEVFEARRRHHKGEQHKSRKIFHFSTSPFSVIQVHNFTVFVVFFVFVFLPEKSQVASYLPIEQLFFRYRYFLALSLYWTIHLTQLWYFSAFFFKILFGNQSRLLT